MVWETSRRARTTTAKPTLSGRLSSLRPIAWIFFYLAIRRVNKLIEEGNKAEAKYVWIKTKWGACGIFLACVFFHSIAVLWMGLYGLT